MVSVRSRVRVVHGERLVGGALRMAAREDQSQMASRLANGKSPGWEVKTGAPIQRVQKVSDKNAKADWLARS
jgi:hypothetical protein